MLKSLFSLATDVAEIAAVPVKVAADLTRAVTRPLADAAKEIADGVEELTKRDDEGRK